MTHPLTDEMCENISCFHLSNWGDTGEGIKQDMRSAADWQLGQVLHWLRKHGGYYVNPYLCYILADLLEEKMRGTDWEGLSDATN